MTTVEDQPRADERMPHLMALAGMGWKTGVSVEPMLGQVELGKWIGTHNCHLCYSMAATRASCERFFPEDCEEDECERSVCPRCGRSGGVGEWNTWMGRTFDGPGLSWVICGGETGPGARPMHPDWVRGLRDQCGAAGVLFFFKQWGEFQEGSVGNAPELCVYSDGRAVPATRQAIEAEQRRSGINHDHPGNNPVIMARVGKHAAGRLLDGQEWNEFPEVRS